jgi:hypothetical protein
MVGYRRDFGKSILGANQTCGCLIARDGVQERAPVPYSCGFCRSFAIDERTWHDLEACALAATFDLLLDCRKRRALR